MIPREAPRLAVDTATGVRINGNYLDMPVVGDDVVLVTGSHDGPVLAAVDMSTGAIRARLSLPAEYAEAPEGGLGGILPDGTFVVPVYLKDLWLRLLHLGPDGDIRRTFEFGKQESRDYWIFGSDVSTKLFAGPVVPVGNDEILFSWIYRGGVFTRYELRRVADLGLRWGANAWPHGLCGDVVVGETTLKHYRRDPDVENGRWLVARSVATGARLWGRPLARDDFEALESVIGCTETAVILADRSARVAEWNEKLLELISRTPEPPRAEVDAFDGEPIAAPTKLFALDARTGTELWTLELTGKLLSAVVGAGAVAVATDRGIAIVDADRGAIVARGDAKKSIVAAATKDAVLHLDDDHLVAAHVHDGELRESWRLPSARMDTASRPLADDRWLGYVACCRLRDAAIVARGGDHVLVWRASQLSADHTAASST